MKQYKTITVFGQAFEAMFDYLVNNLAHLIERCETNYRDPLSVPESVSITLYYLSTGGYYNTYQDNKTHSDMSVSI